MNRIQRTTLEKAKTIYGKITVCPTAKTWEDSFKSGMLWFNTEDHSTHTVRVEESEEPHESSGE